MTRHLEALLIWPLAIAHALLARLLAPAAEPPRVLPCGPSRGTRRPAVAPPALPAAATVADLRRAARSRGIRTAGGRPIASARRADLLGCLGYDSAACS